MKKRLGFILCISGILLMVQPDFNTEEITMMLNYLLAHYWPLGLIVLGASMMSRRSKPRRNKN